MENVLYALGSAQEREEIASALRDVSDVAASLRAAWAIIGGHALIAHGVPRDTPEIDVLVASNRLKPISAVLVKGLGWAPQMYEQESRSFVNAEAVTVHTKEDHLPPSVGFSRSMIPLRRRRRTVCVKLHGAHLPIELDALAAPETMEHFSVPVPVAPLGAVLLMKGAANRVIDLAAIEQTAEHLRSAVLNAAIEWAMQREPELAEGVRCVIDTARARRVPVSIHRIERKK